MFGAGWRRIFAEHRRTIVAVGVLAVANLVGYLAVVYPLEARYTRTLSRVEQSRTALGAATLEERNATAAVHAKRQADRDLAQFYSAVLPQSESEARRLTYRRMAEMARSHGLDFDRRTFSLEAEADSRLDRLTMTMTVSGTYQDIRRFLHELETSPAFLVIRGLALEQPDVDVGPVEMRMELATYVDRNRGAP